MIVLVENWLPPSRENWELVSWLWQFFPLLTAVQWLTDFYPQGKTSIPSRFNLPGAIAWFIMEIPGTLIVIYCMATLPQLTQTAPLPWGNWTMAALYTTHYAYRAVLSPLVLNPSMSPIHALVFLSAAAWQATNGLVLAGWLAGYGPTTAEDWSGRLYVVELGLVVWGWGLLGNMFHDDDLREIRRAALRKQRAQALKADSNGTASATDATKVYMMPKNGLFHYVLYAHYLCEWIEWAGFWMVGGWDCVPARSFLLNEISTMLPRALAGRRWYLAKFGEERVAGRKAVIPGIL